MVKKELPNLKKSICAFLEEDIGSGDLTAAIIPSHVSAQAEVMTREDMVMCGRHWFNTVFGLLGDDIQIQWLVDEGRPIAAGGKLCHLSGPARASFKPIRTMVC